MGTKIDKIEKKKDGDGNEVPEPAFSSKEEELIALYTAYLDKIKDREGMKWDKKREEVKKKLDKIKK